MTDIAKESFTFKNIYSNESSFNAAAIEGGLKRGFDILAATSGLVILSPLMAYLYISVKKTGKTAIYGHTRIGKGGKEFQCLKFRTMVENSAEVLDNLLKTDAKAKAEWKKSRKLKNDPRITEIGKFLRKTSLDELPQLWNVLKGDMSIVGPRPVTADELSYYGDKAKDYKSVRPGITGIWQVSGRSDTSYRKRVILDYTYSKKHNLLWDIKIILQTVKVIVKGQGAY